MRKFKTLAEIEKAYIMEVLATSPSTSQAARVLGIGRSTIYRKMHEYGLTFAPSRKVVEDNTVGAENNEQQNHTIEQNAHSERNDAEEGNREAVQD